MERKYVLRIVAGEVGINVEFGTLADAVKVGEIFLEQDYVIEIFKAQA